MPLTRSLLRGTTTLEAALDEEENMLFNLAYPEKRIDFFVSLIAQRKDIEDTVSYHLGLASPEICRLGEVKEWIHGSFNVCIPVYVDHWKKNPGRRVLIRFPLPYKIGESTFPGNADEKLRCEAATYVWMQDHCPDVPIPFLWGFGFIGGQSVRRFKLILLPCLLIGVHAVYQARECILEIQVVLVPSAALIIAVWVCLTLPLYYSPSSMPLGAWVFDH